MKILALGSNLSFNNNTPEENINSAYQFITNNDIKILKRSHIYKSEAYPNKSDPLFCNSAISIETDLKPEELLNVILDVEKKFGRERKKKNNPRTLDIDIISYDNLILNENDKLVIPHPHLHKRLFVLLPLKDISQEWKHPVFLKTTQEFIEEFDAIELNKVKKIK